MEWTQRAVIRPVWGGDEDRIRRFLAGLSPQTQLLRFFAGVNPPSKSLTRILSFADARQDVLVATAAGEIVGHAMSILQEKTIEIAVVVADEWQDRGVGSLLLNRLLDRARSRGADQIHMDLLPSNRRLLTRLRRDWPAASWRTAAGIVEMDSPLGP